MTEENNVTPIGSDPKPNPLVVAVLETALADAKAGKVCGAILVTQAGSETMLQRAGELIAPNVFSLLDQFRFSYHFDRLLKNRGAP